METQKGYVIFPWKHHQKMAELGFKPRSACTFSIALD